MKRFICLSVIITLGCLLSEALIWGQATAPAAADKKQPEAGQPSRFVKDESWYTIVLNGEKVGSRHTTLDEIPVQVQGSTATQKAYVFLQEVFLGNPAALPYVKLSEEMQFNASDMTLLKSTLRLSLADKREIVLKGNREGDKLMFVTTIITPVPSGEPVSQPPANQEFADGENLYSEQALGFLLINNNWTVNQSYPLKLINSYNPGNLFADAHLMIREKTTQRIMGVPTEGYMCSLVVMDPSSSVKDMEYFIGLNGMVLKQATGNLTAIKISQEEYASGMAAKRVFEPKGRIDPFVPRLTAIGPGRTSGSDTPVTPPKTPIGDVWLTEAREQLQLMKDIYEKTPAEERDALLVAPYQRILDLYGKVNSTNDIKAKNEMEDIRTEAERLFGGAEKIYAEAVYIRNEAKNDFEGGMTMGLYKDIPKKLVRISELVDRKEIRKTEYQSKVKALVDEVAELARRAKIIEEFFATRPVISGIIYYMKAEEVKLQPLVINFLGSEISLPISYFKQIPASSIMIGTKVYKEGDKVSDDLAVKTIRPNVIIFDYKNEEISLEYKGR
ncbi:MAG: general secretion pathway protein GspB [Planctomycetes bacterium]|nr:general secretion pathway protein GspB [Planctomycetota bacterium]